MVVPLLMSLFLSSSVDDVVLLASSAAGLHRHLDVLLSFCTTWGLSVNLEKTKVMVFNTNW